MAKTMKMKRKNKLLKKILKSYRIYYVAAMRATSLGLCKRAIKHALEDEQKIRKLNTK